MHIHVVNVRDVIPSKMSIRSNKQVPSVTSRKETHKSVWEPTGNWKLKKKILVYTTAFFFSSILVDNECVATYHIRRLSKQFIFK